jgi:hypothetical protein
VKIVADGGEDDVCGVALTAFNFKMAAAEVAVGLHVSDHGLDCRATPQFGLDGAPALRKPPSPALDHERAWETTERL